MKKNEKCWLKTEHKQCCCKCSYHLTDYEHCTTNPALRKQKDNTCVCSIVKGYICAPPEFDGRCYSNWPKHSVGCEMYTPVKKAKP